MNSSRDWTIEETAAHLRGGDVTAVTLAEEALARIAADDEQLGAWLAVYREQALAQAHAADERLRAGDPLTTLTGVPLGIKDNFNVVGMQATAGSKILGEYVARYESTATARLREAGAVLVGKTNLDEFAMGSSGEFSGFLPTKNPWDLAHTPGGSSSGSTVAVAARHVPGALGTDTGGSVRQPSSHCGVVGVKPSYGRVSRYGIFAFASSLDQVGPLARTVRDCALLLQHIAGHDERDATSVPLGVPNYLSACGRGLDGLRIGVPREYFGEGIDPQVENAVRRAIRVMEQNGAEVLDISLPHTPYCVAAYYLIASAECSSNLARYDGVRYGARNEAADLGAMYTATRQTGFGPEVTRRILLGTFALSAGYYDAYYLKALKARTLIRNDFLKVFNEIDVIAAPVAPSPATRFGEHRDDPLAMYLSDILTISANLAGICGMSVPCGMSPQGLPIGLQLLGPAFGEEKMFAAAAAYEAIAAHEWPWPEVTA